MQLLNKKVFDEETTLKYNAIKNCSSYNSWPKHAIENIIKLFEWRHFSANTSNKLKFSSHLNHLSHL